MKRMLLLAVMITTLWSGPLAYSTTHPQDPQPASPSAKNQEPPQGRGAVFGVRPTATMESVQIVYLLDVSGSMRRGNRLAKAQEALKLALAELKSTDTFNVVSFANTPEQLSPKMLPATLKNKQKAVTFIEGFQVRDGTNLSSAMESALKLENITHVFVLSDGEPTGGIRDPMQLRTFIKQQNTQQASVVTLALIMGEQSPGFEVLKQIAEDNHGTFKFVNMSVPMNAAKPKATEAVLTKATPQNPPESPKSADAVRARLKYEGEVDKLQAEYAKKLDLLREQYMKDLDAVRKKALEKEDLDEAQRLLEEKRRAKTEQLRPGTSRGLTLLCALIGLDDNWIDITDILRKDVKNSRLYMGPGAVPNPAIAALPDLAPGRHKSVIIAYTFDGKAYVSITRDEEIVDLPKRK